MKKFLSIVSVLAVMVIAGTSSAKAESYVINDEAVEAVFAAAVAAPISVDYINAAPTVPTEQAKVTGGKNPWVAFALAFVVGYLGVHRFYLGTAVLTGVGYILTCGGFGIVAFVDWIVLLVGAIEKDIDKYEDNTKFFMW
ncbi:MAG: TM2 domain-containing protein [Bacteroidota bacterium]